MVVYGVLGNLSCIDSSRELGEPVMCFHYSRVATVKRGRTVLIYHCSTATLVEICDIIANNNPSRLIALEKAS